MWTLLLAAIAAMPTGRAEPQEKAQAPEPVGVARLRRDAESLRPLVESDLARAFLAATAELPAVGERVLYRDPSNGAILAGAEAERLDPEAGAKLTRLPIDETTYYHTRYGSPLAYARPLELLGRRGLESVDGRKVLDFGYGTIGHLRLLASQGADAVGVDVDPFLKAIYAEPGDQGRVEGSGGRTGSLRLVHGRFPADPAVVESVGSGYDLILSKNTLKRGYVHPEGPVQPRQRLDLGVDDAAFLSAIRRSLKPGGTFLIYNLGPAPSKPGEPYKPMADGRCPFGREAIEAAGLDVVAFDEDDFAAARAQGKALGWDRGPGAMDLETDLFATFTLIRKPPEPPSPK